MINKIYIKKKNENTTPSLLPRSSLTPPPPSLTYMSAGLLITLFSSLLFQYCCGTLFKMHFLTSVVILAEDLSHPLL